MTSTWWIHKTASGPGGWGGRVPHHPLARVLLWPGLATQRLTTQEPDDSQLEVALEALKAVLAREEQAKVVLQ